MNLIRTSIAQVIVASWRPSLLLACILFFTLLFILYATGDLGVPVILSFWLWNVTISSMVAHELGHLLTVRIQGGSVKCGNVHSSWSGVWISVKKDNRINMRLAAFAGPIAGAILCCAWNVVGAPSVIVYTILFIHLANLIPPFADGVTLFNETYKRNLKNNVH